MQAYQSILAKIKQKREISSVSDSLVSELLKAYLTKYNLDLSDLKPSEEKIVVKEIREELRKYTGRFQKSPRQKKKLYETESWEELLQAHTSTAERISFYPELKSIVKSLSVKTILDIGCGLNPLALASKEYYYFASDINEEDIIIVDKFFKKNNLPGKTFIFNLRAIQTESKHLPSCDLCVLFKVLDILAGEDRKKRNILTENLLEKVKAKHFLISFSTKKLSGKKMNFPRREWFERILLKKGLKFRTFSSANEIFYLTSANL